MIGYGDSLMATGEARVLREIHPGRLIAIGDGKRVRWDSHVFDRNPFLADQAMVDRGADVVWLHNYAGHRPYIDYPETLALGCQALGTDGASVKRTLAAARRWIWKDYHAIPGEMFFFTDQVDAVRLLDHGPPYVVIEPHVKGRASPNKSWGMERYGRVVAALRGEIRFVQLGSAGTERLEGATLMVTANFRQACAFVNSARAYVGNEGGLHHAAAAMAVPGVVIFGGFIPPAITGYAIHDNLTHATHFCGSRGPCGHCDRAMAEIEVDEVVEALRATVEN